MGAGSIRGRCGRASTALAFCASALLLLPALAGASEGERTRADRLQTALDGIVGDPEGPPGVSMLIKGRKGAAFYRSGTANVETGAPPRRNQQWRIASMAKALSGAVTLSLVSKGKLEVDDEIGEVLPGLWSKADDVTLGQVLQHTATLPDYIRQPEFIDLLTSNPGQYLTPRELISFVSDLEPTDPGAFYEYSDSDNIIAGLMAEKAGGRSYNSLLQRFVYAKAGMESTSLPDTITMPEPYMRGYDVAPGQDPEDVSELINPALAWASGGIVSTSADMGRFFRAYVSGQLFDKQTARNQRDFVKGSSDPPGPGSNEATLGLFRYKSRCGTVFGHTGSFPGYRVFAAATRDGKRSVVFVANAQIVSGFGSPRVSGKMRQAQADAVCLALR